jgi:hypothetical protein
MTTTTGDDGDNFLSGAAVSIVLDAGDSTADFSVTLTGAITLVAGDFLL